MGHAIILAYLFVGVLASSGYLAYCRKENRARQAGLRDETLLSDEKSSEFSDSREARIAHAKELRAQRVRELKSQGFRGKIKALYASLDEGGGGVYADLDEARTLKGDAWSGFGQYQS
jgi:hypothetical protein